MLIKSDSIRLHNAVCGGVSSRTALCFPQQCDRNKNRRFQSIDAIQATLAQESSGHWHLAAYIECHLQDWRRHQRA